MNPFCSPLPCKEWFLTDPDGISIRLRGPNRPRPHAQPVLFTHGLSAASNTAEANEGVPEQAEDSLAHWMAAQDVDLWLLDWRGSSDPRLLERLRARVKASGAAARTRRAFAQACFNYDRVAAWDLPRAIAHVVAQGYRAPLGVVAHCMGAGALAWSLCLRALSGVERVVFTGGGLFLQVPVQRRVLVGDELIADHRAEFGTWMPTVDVPVAAQPHPWGPAERLFQLWRRSGPLHRLPEAPEDFQRQSFLYGEPYDPRRLPRLHAHGTQGLFGDLSVDLGAHTMAWVRGVGPVEGPQVHPRRPRAVAAQPGAARGFAGLRSIRFVTGQDNRLWHRRTVDQTVEWLRRELPEHRERVVKHVLRGWAHQDLYWGRGARETVFPLIAAGLGLGPTRP